MKTPVAIVLTLVTLLVPALTSAQAAFAPSTNPVSDEVRRRLSSDAKHLTVSAELMPADKFSYHPTEAQMPFGLLVAHIVQTNAALCSAASGLPISGTQYPSLTLEQIKSISGAASKEALVNALKQSFDYCTEGFATLTDAQLGDEAVVFGRRTGMSRGGAAVTIVADWADHYSSAASYLRLNGILPPSAKPAK